MGETLESIQKYLDKVFKAVDSGEYRILSTTKNNTLEYNYLINIDTHKRIIKSLEPADFIEIVISTDKLNEGHHLYVFAKQCSLTNIFTFDKELVDLYIKFDHECGRCLIVVSFHKQEKPISYYFK